jgi:hypothetical protein
MNVEERLANDPYYALRDRLRPTLVRSYRLVVLGALGIAGALIWISSDPFNPLRLLIVPMLVFMLTLYAVMNGIGAPRRRMQQHVLHVLQQAQYDDKTLAHIESMAQIGAKTPWMSYDAAIVAAIAAYRREARPA